MVFLVCFYGAFNPFTLSPFRRLGQPVLWPSSPPSVAPEAAVATAPRVDMQRIGELQQHGIDLVPLHHHCTEARMLT